MSNVIYSKLPSKNGRDSLCVYTWSPEGTPRAILQISHGMAEYLDRYDRFAKVMNEHGILVIGNDHLGHGRSVKSAADLGFFDTKERSATVVDDLYQISCKAKEMYPDVPLILLGHSMGSFLARRYLMTYGQLLDGAIIMGTGSQPALLLFAAKLVATILGGILGQRYRSRLINFLAFGSYNQKIDQPVTPNDWLTRDAKIVAQYQEDPLCGYIFTINGFKTLFDVIGFIQTPANIKKLPHNLPTLFVAGACDPVGRYGKDVTNVFETCKAEGMKDSTLILYPQDRHEILNELDFETVDQDIIRFIERVIRFGYDGKTNT